MTRQQLAAGPWAADRASGLSGESRLAMFNEAGVLEAADIHVALALGRLGGDDDELVLLAAALAVRAPRMGHVLVDLDTVAEPLATDEEGRSRDLPWPAPAEWAERLAASPLVSLGEDGPEDRPLRLVKGALYLDRYWRDEGLVAASLLARASEALPLLDEGALQEGLVRLFPGPSDQMQREAATAAVRRHLSVVAGGPGTGKTTTVARLLALLEEQAAATGSRPPLVALAAPTGKAAARMSEAVQAEALDLDVTPPVRSRLLALSASTVHRLLGRHPSNASRFRHDGDNRLPHDVVVIDETSMMSLPLMARLVEAVRPDARLVLLGDQQQLASVEAGAVLADIVGRSCGAAARAPSPKPLARCITVLRANYRFAGPLAELAAAVTSGDPDRAMAVLRQNTAGPAEHPEQPPDQQPYQPDQPPDRGAGGVAWLPVQVGQADETLLQPVKAALLVHGHALLEAAQAGQADEALAALERFRILCAHRDGPAGASTWNALSEQWLAVRRPLTDDVVWYLGRPLIVHDNDYSLGLFNGDGGVVVARHDGGPTAVFRRGGGTVALSPSRIPSAGTAFALTAHRAQGSEFDEVVVILPPVSSPVLTRELLYTALTRARRRVMLVGTEAVVREAVLRPVARASGLSDRLWS